MFRVINIARRVLEGSLLSIFLIGVIAIAGISPTISMLIADRSLASLALLLVIAIVLADLIAKLIAIFQITFPDLIPKLDDGELKRASLLRRLRAGQTMALLSGAYLARIALFLLIFALLGVTYTAAPTAVQNHLFGELTAASAIEVFLREGVAGAVGYFLFFLGPNSLTPITDAISPDRLVSSSADGDVFLAGIRLYGLAFVFAVLRALLTPVIFMRARNRAAQVPVG